MPMMRRRPVMRTVGENGGDRRHGDRGGRRGEPSPAAEVRRAGGRGAAGGAAAGGRAGTGCPRRTPTTSINKLKELANLKDQGILTEAEFNDQKAKILAEM